MPELRALTREHRLRNYSRLRKAELIAFLQYNDSSPPVPASWMSPRGTPKGCYMGTTEGTTNQSQTT